MELEGVTKPNVVLHVSIRRVFKILYDKVITLFFLTLGRGLIIQQNVYFFFPLECLLLLGQRD